MVKENQIKEPIYSRNGNFAVFNQLGVKLDFSNSTKDEEYYEWLDKAIKNIGQLIPGAEIAEKDGIRIGTRLNTGVYYDTDDYRLLNKGMVLRTTCDVKTHAFCAFKLDETEQKVRRDHRYVFEGEAKRTIQNSPTSPKAIAFVKELLARKDIEHPGTQLKELTGIVGEDLSPAICIEQHRHPFFVWIDKRDALRCSMDRVSVYNMRLPLEKREKFMFSEIEIPIYPHVDDDMVNDPRLHKLIEILSNSLKEQFNLNLITDSKYQRAAKLLKLL